MIVWEGRILAISFQYKHEDHLRLGEFIKLRSGSEGFLIDLFLQETPPLSHHHCICFANISYSFDFYLKHLCNYILNIWFFFCRAQELELYTSKDCNELTLL